MKNLNVFILINVILLTSFNSYSIESKTSSNIANLVTSILDNTQHKLVNAPEPYYPRLARFNEIEGYVTANIVFNREGEVIDIDILEAENVKHFEQAVLYTVSSWMLEPSKVNQVTINKTFNFRMLNNIAKQQSSDDDLLKSELSSQGSSQVQQENYNQWLKQYKLYKKSYKKYVQRKHGS